LNLLLDIIRYTMFRPEELSRQILRFTVVLGVAISAKSLLSRFATDTVILATLASLLILTLSHLYLRGRVEKEFNRAIRRVITSSMEPTKLLETMEEVELKGKSYLDYIFEEYREPEKSSEFKESKRSGGLLEGFIGKFNWHLAILILATQFTLFLTFVGIAVLLLIIGEAVYDPLSRLGITEGSTLVAVSYLLALALYLEPIERKVERREQTRQAAPLMPDIASLVESFMRKFLYENIMKKPYGYLYVLLLSFLDLVLPNVKLRVERLTAKFGILICSSMLYDTICKLKERNLIEVEGSQSIVQFFQCSETRCLQAWSTLENIGSLEEALGNIVGVSSQHPQAFLKLNVKRDGEVVGYIVMKAWKGCKIKFVPSKRKSFRALEQRIVGNVRLISIFAVGIREPIELIWAELVLSSRPPTIQERLCIEEEATTQPQTAQQQQQKC